MGMVTAALAAAALVAGVAGGVMAKNAADDQAEMAEEQAGLRAAETNRLTTRQAELEQREIDKTVDRQKLAYLASGVSLEGSPLLKMEETRRLGAENIDEIRKAGSAQQLSQIMEGRATAEAARASGRQALVQGISSGAKGALSTYAGAQ